MQLTQDKQKNVNLSKIESLMKQENAFIKNLFSKMCMPQRLEDASEIQTKMKNVQSSVPSNRKSRAQSLTELQQRLEAITSKSSLSFKDKMLKKGLKNRMKKKNKIEERKAHKKLVNIHKIKTDEIKQEANEKPAKPVFNSEGKMVFSKFDFSNIGKANKKHLKDPKKILEDLEKQNEKIAQLKESGDVEKAVEIKEKTSWKNALAKVSGEKVRDDPILLKKTIKKREQQHKSSKKKWEARQNAVVKAKEGKQKKRQENLDKRKKTKKLNKLKKAAKKGKIIPGF